MFYEINILHPTLVVNCENAHDYNTSFMQFYLLKMKKTWKEPANQDLFHVFSTYNVFTNHALRYFLSTALTAPGPVISSLNISSTVSPIPAS